MAKKRKEIRMEKKGKKKPKQKSSKARVFRITILLLLIVGALYLIYAQLLVPTREAKKPLSILLVGSDMSDFREDYFMDTKPEKTDSLIVVTFNPNTYTMDMTSIPRDTSVDYICDSIQDVNGNPYTGEPYQDQINEIYQVSGKDMSCLTDTVENFLNIPIDYYVKVNMDELAGIIDAVGGIEIKVYAPDYYLSQENASLTETYYWTNDEVLTMNGDEALTYARSRHDSEADYGRGIRQQQVFSAILESVLKAGVNKDLISSMYNLVETDMPLVLVYEYYQYGMSIKAIFDMMNGSTEITFEDLPIDVWLNLYDLTGFDGNLAGTAIQQNREISEFVEYVQSGAVDISNLKEELLKNHQLYNTAYSAHYNVDYEQLYEVSNELRANLELEESDLDVPSYPYGDNYAYGLMPKETTLAKQGLI